MHTCLSLYFSSQWWAWMYFNEKKKPSIPFDCCSLQVSKRQWPQHLSLLCFSIRMRESLSWRPVWKLCACWPFRSGPERLRSSCRMPSTSTWDRYTVTLSHSLCWVIPLAVTSDLRAAVGQILKVHHDREISGHMERHSLQHMRLQSCQLLRMSTLTSMCCKKSLS